MKEVWLIIKEDDDYFHNDKYYNIDVFETKEDAEKYFEDYLDILLYELENDYNDRIRADDGCPFEEVIEITREKNYVRIFLDDCYYIFLEIARKEVMRMGGC